MALTDDDVRQILRLIDESAVDELRIETGGLSLYVRRGGAAASAPPLAPPAAREATEDSAAEPDPSASSVGVVFEAPMLGTFYRADSPNDPPFIKVGDKVQPDTVLCLIEVMKLMNHIQAGLSGTVVEVLAENAQLVEFGQPLFRIQPDG